jgi:hypothetical protein
VYGGVRAQEQVACVRWRAGGRCGSGAREQGNREEERRREEERKKEKGKGKRRKRIGKREKEGEKKNGEKRKGRKRRARRRNSRRRPRGGTRGGDRGRSAMRARRLRAERGKDGVNAVGFGCRFRVSGRLGFRGG